MIRHLRNPKFEAAIMSRALRGDIFRNTKTGELVVGEFSSFATSELRYMGWRRVGRPTDIEDLARVIGLRVISVRDHEWEHEVAEYRSSTGWRQIGNYKIIITVDDAFLQKIEGRSIAELRAARAISLGLQASDHVFKESQHGCV